MTGVLTKACGITNILIKDEWYDNCTEWCYWDADTQLFKR